MKKLLIISLSFITAISVKSQVGIGTTTPNSTLQVAGSVSAPTVTITANYIATANDYTILCNNTGANIIISLPAASGCTGRMYIIKKISSGSKNTTVDPNASENIEGVTTKVVVSVQYDSVIIQSDGSQWFILSKS